MLRCLAGAISPDDLSPNILEREEVLQKGKVRLRLLAIRE